jgi:hypothetical protein
MVVDGWCVWSCGMIDEVLIHHREGKSSGCICSSRTSSLSPKPVCFVERLLFFFHGLDSEDLDLFLFIIYENPYRE